ncbi:flavin monoamine oxidase family protein [Salinarimonas ramus]|uniref:Oxidoreductase n=1 Tax=Salinarimonas ramus TaxID=690164 RepID=A0A917QIR7_9HYPH|nr:NAD(P)/FAD-dependent oxidoreductase [Salinarimonas ramus]GGK50928.1 oxidoreductase [Salinarimonas ramus]
MAIASTEPPADEAVDVAVVGGGMAGLVAAWHLRHRRCVVLEASDRPGGRLHAPSHDGVPMNLGAHMVPGPGTAIGDLVAELGLEARPLPPHLFGLDFRGRRHMETPATLLPFVMRLGLAERIAFMRMGAHLRLGAHRSTRAARPRARDTDALARVLAFEDGRTLAELVGPLPAGVDLLFRGLTERNGADPSEMSAGHGLRSFANVWAKTAPGTNLVGGTATLPKALASRLGEAVFRPRHEVIRARAIANAVEGAGGVAIDVRTPQGERRITARACILATPAPITRAIARGLPDETASALERIRYGAFLTLAVSLAPLERVPWRGTYAIATPELGFSVLFDHDAMRPEAGGHSIMLFRGARGALRWMEEDDATIVSRWLEDLETRFPETRERVRETVLQRWPAGAPFAAPGRASLQPPLEAIRPPFLLAGDYLEFPNMEAAAASGVRAAAAAQRRLAA